MGMGLAGEGQGPLSPALRPSAAPPHLILCDKINVVSFHCSLCFMVKYYSIRFWALSLSKYETTIHLSHYFQSVTFRILHYIGANQLLGTTLSTFFDNELQHAYDITLHYITFKLFRVA